MRHRFVLWIVVATSLAACTNNWLSYRNSAGRYGQQFHDSELADASKVLNNLHVGWKSPDASWTASTMPGPFRASPIMFHKTVYIGDMNGVFWALNASDGSFQWRYPAAGSGLNGTCTLGFNGSWGAYGIQSSASYAKIGGRAAVIFGAPDPDPATDSGNGTARLWALDAATGSLIWKSDVVASVPTCGVGNIHERITYSSPLVAFDRVYVGVHDAADNPVQKGRLVAVDLNTGHVITSGFPFIVDGAPLDMTCGGVCGGGIWDSPATDGKGIIFTTGNVCDFNTAGSSPCETEPNPDYSLSMVSVDPTSGALLWSFRAVPFPLDNDPDWSAGPTSMLTSCGRLMASVQKNGWTYAIDSANGSCKWQFPSTAGPSCVFPSNAVLDQGDDDYKQPGASWGDYLYIQAAGQALTTSLGDYPNGYGIIQSLDACQPDDNHRVRWVAPIAPGIGYSIGAPTVTGGMVYVTTSNGHVIGLADPLIAPLSIKGWTCSNPNFSPPSPTWVADCLLNSFAIVPVPGSVDVTLDDGGDAVGLRMEPAIAHGKLFVATGQGHVYALWP